MNDNMCETCGHVFKLKTDYTRHINKKIQCVENGYKIKYTESEKQIKALMEKNEELEELNKYLQTCMTDLIHSNRSQKISKKLNSDNTNKTNSDNKITNTNSNNTYNIIVPPLVDFGKQDDSFIDEAMTRKILNKGFDSIQEYIKMVHFNIDKPEYHNVYLPNNRDRKNVLVYQKNKWNMCDRDTIISELKDNGIDFIQKKYDELDEDDENDAIIIAKLKKFLKKYNAKGSVPYLDNDLMLILYNNRDMIKKKPKAKLKNL